MADAMSRGGERYVTPEIDAYLTRVHVSHDAVFGEAFLAPTKHDVPAIQLGPHEAKLLTLLAQLTNARKVVEIGTLCGYSALHLARGMTQGGHLWTIEVEARHAAIARTLIAKADLAPKITVVEARAAEALETLVPEAPFDLVFVDADKGNYDRYVGSSRVDLQACKLEYSIVSPK